MSNRRDDVAGPRRGTIAALIVSALVGLLASRDAVPLDGAATAKAHVATIRSSGVPVLLYHRVVARRGAVAPAVFEAQMRRLHDFGFSPITLATYVRYMRGGVVDLPKRPILLTFDDGFRSSWMNTRSVLARYGWSAAMYIPTGFVGLPGRLTWEELRLMQKSRNWQIDEHAGDGHVYVSVDAGGAKLPFYAAKRWVDGKQESFAEYKTRVRRDIELGAAMLARNLPGWRSHGTFALPYGDYGQRGSNDPRVEQWLTNLLKARFAVTFAQASDRPTPGTLGLAGRISVSWTWDARMLEARLLRELERFASQSGGHRGSG